MKGAERNTGLSTAGGPAAVVGEGLFKGRNKVGVWCALNHAPPVRWYISGYGRGPYSGRMQNYTRFEFKLPAERRAELDDLAAAAGLTTTDLVRLAIRRLLEQRATVLKLSGGSDGRR